MTAAAPGFSTTPTDRTYKRDKDGKFSSGSGGVREELSGATTAQEVSAAAAAEAKRITGRDIEFDFAGSDPGIAKEHAEGILRGLERYPKTKLDRVAMSDLPEGTFGRTLTINGERSVIVFGTDAQRYGAAGYRGDLKNAEQSGEIVARSPMGVALHEFGHAAANQYGLNGWANNRANQYAEIEMGSTDTSGSIRKAISHRATENNSELSAEAFADVMTNGEKASGMSKLIVDTFDAEIRAADAPDEDD